MPFFEMLNKHLRDRFDYKAGKFSLIDLKKKRKINYVTDLKWLVNELTCQLYTDPGKIQTIWPLSMSSVPNTLVEFGHFVCKALTFKAVDLSISDWLLDISQR